MAWRISRKSLIAFLFAGSIFFVSIWYLVGRFQWEDAFKAIGQVNIIRLAALTWIAHFLFILSRAWRWWIIARHSNPNIPFMEIYWATAIVLSLSMLTPGNSGEVLKVEFLRRRGLLNRLPGVGGFAVERVFDVLALSCMFLLGFLFGSGLKQDHQHVAYLAATLLLISVFFLYVVFWFLEKFHVVGWIKKIHDGCGPPCSLLGVFILSASSWFFVGVGWYICLYSIGVFLSLWEVLWLISTVTLGTIISLIPSGLGVAEIIIVTTLISMGIDTQDALASSIILRLYTIILISFGFINIFLKSILFLKKQKDA